MDFKHIAELALTLAAFLREDVTQMRLAAFIAARRITFEALGSAPIGISNSRSIKYKTQ